MMGVCQSTALKCIFERVVCVQSLGFISCRFFQNKVLQFYKRQARKHLNEQAKGGEEKKKVTDLDAQNVRDLSQWAENDRHTHTRLTADIWSLARK